jgi:hypothetical protein
VVIRLCREVQPRSNRVERISITYVEMGLFETERTLSPNFGDGLRVQEIWDFEDAGLVATYIRSGNLTP